MNKIRQLLNEQFVVDLFTKEVLPHYPVFSAVKRVVIKPYKDMIWETTYHVVIGFDTYFLKPSGEEVKIPIVCSAHSSEPRENVFQALKFLWAQGFPTDKIDLPDPLFYSEYFRGTFYRGLKGENLLYYIQRKDYESVEMIIVAAARLFARLHSMPANLTVDFNPANSRIKTVTPGLTRLLEAVGDIYDNKYNADLEAVYHHLINQEEEYFSRANCSLSLIHGDAHPENIIKTAADRVGLIDFTDFCLGDFTRDLGTFLQQLDFKIITKAGDPAYANKLSALFLDAYWGASGKSMIEDYRRRINLYYNFTAVRTAVYFFMKYGRDEKRGVELLRQVRDHLDSRGL